MSVSDLDNIEEASLLTGDDLNGLLKAARLTKYVPDSEATSDPTTFEKSANLFDLVKSKIEKFDPLDEPSEQQIPSSEAKIDDAENASEIELINFSELDVDVETPADIFFEETAPVDAIPPIGALTPQASLVDEKDMSFSDDKDIQNVLTHSLDTDIESNDLESSSGSGQKANSSYEDAYIVAKLEFEQLLKVEIDNFQNLTKTLFSVSQTIIGATEEKLKIFILETASKLSGERIDQIPEKYLTKISGIINELSTKTDEITITLNKEDFAAVTKIKNFKDFLYSFDEDEALMRGEFKIQSGKLTSQVKLYENLADDKEPNEL